MLSDPVLAVNQWPRRRELRRRQCGRRPSGRTGARRRMRRCRRAACRPGRPRRNRAGWNTPVRCALHLEPVSPSPTCTVYFDGTCPVCSREIAHYRRQRGSEAIAWVDASNCDEAALGPGLDRSTVLRRFHVREGDGTLTSGAAAFAAIWRRLPAFAWLARLASSRPVLALLDAGYAVFLYVRPWWRRADPRPEAPRAGAAIGRADPASREAGSQAPGVAGDSPVQEQAR